MTSLFIELIENWMPRKPEIGSGPEVGLGASTALRSLPIPGCRLLRGRVAFRCAILAVSRAAVSIVVQSEAHGLEVRLWMTSA